MAFRNIPPNGFPAIPDIEDLEAVVKDVSTLKTTTAGLAEDVGDLEDQKANQITIALPFNPENEYEVGDLVYYNGLTYRCTNEHTGEWDADDFSGTTIANELASLKSGLNDQTTPQLVTTATLASGLSGEVICVKIGQLVLVSGYCTGTMAQNDEIVQNLPAYRGGFDIPDCRYPAILDGNIVSPVMFTASNAISVVAACSSVNFFVMYVTN